MYGKKVFYTNQFSFQPGIFQLFFRPRMDSTSSETHESAIKYIFFCIHDLDFLLLPPPPLPTIKPCSAPHQSSKVLGNKAEMAAARPAWIRDGS